MAATDQASGSQPDKHDKILQVCHRQESQVLQYR